jgi:putative tryptophan/tyrosine transport system substrate-binding protein
VSSSGERSRCGARSGVRSDSTRLVTPTKFERPINMKTAKALGLTIPQSVLLRADQVTDP